jgi:hypothetical protein
MTKVWDTLWDALYERKLRGLYLKSKDSGIIAQGLSRSKSEQRLLERVQSSVDCSLLSGMPAGGQREAGRILRIMTLELLYTLINSYFLITIY